MSDDAYNSQLSSEIDSFFDNLRITARKRRRQLRKMGEDGLLTYCEDSNGMTYNEYQDKKSCKAAGYKWRDMRPLGDRLKEKSDAWKKIKSAPDRHLDQIKEDLVRKMQDLSKDSNPRVNLAHNSSFVEIPYKVFREAAEQGRDWMEFDYDASDPFRFPRPAQKKMFREDDPISVDFTEDANLYIGITKTSIVHAVTNNIGSVDMARAHNGDRSLTAAFSMGIKKAKFSHPANPGDKGKLRVWFYTMPEKNEAIPKDDFTQYVPVDMTNTNYDNQNIWIGRYIDPDAVSADVASTFMEYWKGDMNNGMQKMSNRFAQDVLTMTQEEIFSREFFCCVFFEIISGIPHLKDYLGENLGLDPNHLEQVYIWWIEQKLKGETDPAKIAKLEAEKAEWESKEYSIEQFLIDLKGDIAEIKKWVEIIIGLYTSQGMGFSLPGLGINILKILINAVHMTLHFLIDEVQTEVTRKIFEWVEERKEEINEFVKEELEKQGYCDDDEWTTKTNCEENGGVWTYAGNYKTAAAQCLPWEQLIVLLAEMLTGEGTGLFDQLRGYVDRMKRAMMLRSRNMGLPAYQFEAEAQKDKTLKFLYGLLDICDWLLALNADALTVCGAYSRDLSMLGEDTYADAVTDTLGGINPSTDSITTGYSTDELIPPSNSRLAGSGSSGDNVNVSGNHPTQFSSTTKIDITGNIVDPIGLLVYRTDADVSKFFNQYMGLSPEEAAEAVTSAKKGECFSKMSKEDADRLQEILNNAGVKI
tara:strand:+ start:3058 stop:5322 length:2265 start_codon:yes stop_codon:yes gene_type:complete